MAEDGAAAAQIDSDRDLLPIAVLATGFAIVIFTIAMPIVLMRTDYTVLAAPFAPQKQSAETALYLLTIFVFTPAAILLAWWSAGRATATSGRVGFRGLTWLLVIPLGLGLFLLRHSSALPWGNGIKGTLVLGGVWAILAVVTLWFAASGRATYFVRAVESAERPLSVAATVAVAAGLLSLVRLGHVEGSFFAVAVVASALVVWAYVRLRPRKLARPWGIAFDLLVVLVVALAVPNMLIYESGSGDFAISFRNYVTEYHQALFIGAASQVLNGSAQLVDTVSQYGVGSIYLVAAFFKIAPIGFLTLGFFEGLLSATVFAAAYGVLRMAGVSRPLAAGAMAVAVVTLVWGTEYPNGALLQHGAIRFGLPMPLIAAAVASARWPRSRPFMAAIALLVIGISSVWALEAFLYVTATAAALVAMELTWLPRERRLRHLITAALAIAAAWFVTQTAFALITLAASGSLPDWGLYLTYLSEFLTGGIGDLTYDISPWSPGIAVFAVYVISATLIVLLTLMRRRFTVSRSPAFLALAGLTGYGVALFSYFDNRSLDHILAYVSLPALLILTVGLGLVMERSSGFTPRSRALALGGALLLAALSMSSVWPAAGERGKDSLLAYVVPGGITLSDGLDRIWSPPPLKPAAAAGERLVERYMPNPDEVPVLTEPDLDNEILARTGRVNQLRITDAKEASWVPDPTCRRWRRRQRPWERGTVCSSIPSRSRLR